MSQVTSIPSFSSIPKQYRYEPTSDKIRYVDAKRAKQFKELGIPLEAQMLDLEITTLLQDSDPSTLEYKLSYLLRIKVNGKEFVFGYESVSAKDANGNQLQEVSDIPFGRYEQINSNMIERDSSGNIIYVNPAPKTHYEYDVPFSSDLVESMIAETNSDPSRIQFAVVKGNGERIATTYEEFIHLSFAEIEARGKLGFTGFPVDQNIIDRMKTMDGRLALESIQQNKNKVRRQLR